MKFIPHDIRTREFGKNFRGYDPVEVRNFLHDVAAVIDELQHEGADQDRRILELETRLKDYSSVEKALHDTFMQAQETSGKAIENARREAQLIIHEAEVKASQIVDKSRNDLTSIKEQLTILKAKKDSIVSRLKMLLNSELNLIKALEVDEELQSSPPSEDSKESSRAKQEIDEILKSLDQ